MAVVIHAVFMKVAHINGTIMTMAMFTAHMVNQIFACILVRVANVTDPMIRSVMLVCSQSVCRNEQPFVRVASLSLVLPSCPTMLV